METQGPLSDDDPAAGHLPRACSGLGFGITLTLDGRSLERVSTQSLPGLEAIGDRMRCLECPIPCRRPPQMTSRGRT